MSSYDDFEYDFEYDREYTYQDEKKHGNSKNNTYDIVDRLYIMTNGLKRYCEHNSLPIFNRNDSFDIIINDIIKNA
jgi:hypothetical protein